MLRIENIVAHFKLHLWFDMVDGGKIAAGIVRYAMRIFVAESRYGRMATRVGGDTRRKGSSFAYDAEAGDASRRSPS